LQPSEDERRKECQRQKTPTLETDYAQKGTVGGQKIKDPAVGAEEWKKLVVIMCQRPERGE